MGGMEDCDKTAQAQCRQPGAAHKSRDECFNRTSLCTSAVGRKIPAVGAIIKKSLVILLPLLIWPHRESTFDRANQIFKALWDRSELGVSILLVAQKLSPVKLSVCRPIICWLGVGMNWTHPAVRPFSQHFNSVLVQTDLLVERLGPKRYSAHEQDLPPRIMMIKWAKPMNEILSQKVTFNLKGPRVKILIRNKFSFVCVAHLTRSGRSCPYRYQQITWASEILRVVVIFI